MRAMTIGLAWGVACRSPEPQPPGSAAGSSDSVPVPHDTGDGAMPFEVCDGSTDVRLRFQTFGGSTLNTWDPFFSKQGQVYLMIDGNCNFYAYFPLYPLYVWTPVVSGHLDADAFDDLAAAMDLSQWPQGATPLEDPDNCPGHASLYVFSLGDSVTQCSCCSEFGNELKAKATQALIDLYPTAEPYQSPVLEAFVFTPWTHYITGVPDFVGWDVAWGAAVPPEVFHAKPVFDRYADLGVIVSEADRAWFQATMTGFQTREETRNGQEGISVVDDPETATTVDWELFIRPVVP